MVHSIGKLTNDELPTLLARRHPDDQAVWMRYWSRWRAGELDEEVELCLLTPDGAEQ